MHGPRFDSCIIKEYLYFQPLKYITLVNQSPEQGEEGKVKFLEKLSLKIFFLEIQPKVFCEFSVRKKVYFCKPSSESPW